VQAKRTPFQADLLQQPEKERNQKMLKRIRLKTATKKWGKIPQFG